MTNKASLSTIIPFMREFIELRDDGDLGFMPICDCGADQGEHGAILLKGTEWAVRCQECLSLEPADDRREYEMSEVICLTLTKYGRIVEKEPDGDGWVVRIGGRRPDGPLDVQH